jgi:hypothetical protein
VRGAWDVDPRSARWRVTLPDQTGGRVRQLCPRDVSRPTEIAPADRNDDPAPHNRQQAKTNGKEPAHACEAHQADEHPDHDEGGSNSYTTRLAVRVIGTLCPDVLQARGDLRQLCTVAVCECGGGRVFPIEVGSTLGWLTQPSPVDVCPVQRPAVVTSLVVSLQIDIAGLVAACVDVVHGRSATTPVVAPQVGVFVGIRSSRGGARHQSE